MMNAVHRERVTGAATSTGDRRAAALEIVLFTLLLAAAGTFVVAVRARTGWDQDIWWHLRTGQWIAEHRQLPTTDPFSLYGRDKEWVVYSWLFALIAYGSQQALGLKGLVLLAATVAVLIAAAFYVLVRGLGATMLTALALTASGFYAMMSLTTPRPWLFTMLFFVIELHIVIAASRAESPRSRRLLYLLPPLFLLWANLHIQFVVGLLVIGVAAADAFWYERIEPRGAPPVVPLVSWVVVGVLCVLATVIGPYRFALYTTARDLMNQPALWNRIGELLAPDFRHSTDWVTLAMVLVALLCVGWQARTRPVRVFLLLLFIPAVYLGFRSRRDGWLTVTMAACMTAAALRRDTEGGYATQFRGWASALVAIPIALAIVAINIAFVSEPDLRTNVRHGYPEAAAEFIERHGYAGPLYNSFDWGGYLMWRLPRLPVGIDGRTVVHGEPRILAHVNTLQGKPGWRDDPELTAAKLVVVPKDTALASLLRLDNRFTQAYEEPDGPAVVFVAK